ncbi:hypothetical protein Tsubulata_036766 [Turnera subulata]|uniref:Elongation factor Ts, mitochondrial n=1 Tax=Turnera subulata TaxID=218843 RepID=A0A9Q0GH20_9ROSI|nr:hypothetical protein Tsubulata_036766 [Turnera subulata]
MAFCRNARRPLQMLLATSRMQQSHHYSTWPQHKATVHRFAETKTAPNSAFGMSSRRFSSQEPAAAQQKELIKLLRQRTSAPIKDVKASLVACNWDIDEAHKDLRKKGKFLAEKKSGRTAAEGLLALAQSEGKAALIELNCETDFVARNDIFQYLALSLAKEALADNITSQSTSGLHSLEMERLEDIKLNLDHPKVSGEITVQNAITEVAAMMGENVRLRRGFLMSSPGILSTYLHTSPQPGLGRIAGLVSLEIESGNHMSESSQDIGSELAMHVVAAKPLFLNRELVSTDALATELEILKSQAESTGKNAVTVEKMVQGRLRKYYEETVLMEQKYILDDTINIKTHLDNLSKRVGSTVRVENFFRMEVGEGIQRTEGSSADEPVAQTA